MRDGVLHFAHETSTNMEIPSVVVRARFFRLLAVPVRRACARARARACAPTCGDSRAAAAVLTLSCALAQLVGQTLEYAKELERIV